MERIAMSDGKAGVREYVRHLGSIDRHLVQQQIVAPAMREAAKPWRRNLRTIVKARVRNPSPRGSRRLFRFLRVRVVAKRRAAPGVLLLVGTRGTRRDRLQASSSDGLGLFKGQRSTRTVISRRVPPSVHLAFLRGTVARKTAKDYNRGRIKDRMIDRDVRLASLGSSTQIFNRYFNSLAQKAWAFQRGLAA